MAPPPTFVQMNVICGVSTRHTFAQKQLLQLARNQNKSTTSSTLALAEGLRLNAYVETGGSVTTELFGKGWCRLKRLFRMSEGGAGEGESAMGSIIAGNTAVAATGSSRRSGMSSNIGDPANSCQKSMVVGGSAGLGSRKGGNNGVGGPLTSEAVGVVQTIRGESRKLGKLENVVEEATDHQSSNTNGEGCNTCSDGSKQRRRFTSSMLPF